MDEVFARETSKLSTAPDRVKICLDPGTVWSWRARARKARVKRLKLRKRI